MTDATCRWNAAISELRRADRWSSALAMVASMRQAAVRVDSASLNMGIAARQAGGQAGTRWRPALDLLAEFGKGMGSGLRAGLITFNTCMCFEGDVGKPFWPLAVSLVHELTQRGMIPDVFSFSGAVRACSRDGVSNRWRQPGEILSFASRREASCNTVMYNCVLSACERGGSWVQAGCILGEMALLQSRPDVVSLTTAISTCRDDWMEALQALGRLRVRPNLLTCNALLSSCSSASRWESGMALLLQLPSFWMLPDVISINSLSPSDSDERCFWMLALALMQSGAERWKSVPDEVSYNSLLTSSEKAGAWKQALDLCGRMCRTSVQRTVISLGRTVCAWARGHQWRFALRAFKRIIRTGVRANLISFNNALDACDCDWLSAVDLLSSVRHHTLTCNAVSYSTLANALARSAETAMWQPSLHLWQDMTKAGVASNEVTHNSVINACGGTSWSVAMAHVCSMKAERMAPNLISTNSALAACRSKSCWLAVLDLLDYMPLVKLTPDLISHVDAAEACARAGQPHSTLKLLRTCDSNSWRAVAGPSAA